MHISGSGSLRIYFGVKGETSGRHGLLSTTRVCWEFFEASWPFGCGPTHWLDPRAMERLDLRPADLSGGVWGCTVFEHRPRNISWQMDGGNGRWTLRIPSALLDLHMIYGLSARSRQEGEKQMELLRAPTKGIFVLNRLKKVGEVQDGVTRSSSNPKPKRRKLRARMIRLYHCLEHMDRPTIRWSPRPRSHCFFQHPSGGLGREWTTEAHGHGTPATGRRSRHTISRSSSASSNRGVLRPIVRKSAMGYAFEASRIFGIWLLIWRVSSTRSGTPSIAPRATSCSELAVKVFRPPSSFQISTSSTRLHRPRIGVAVLRGASRVSSQRSRSSENTLVLRGASDTGQV